MLLGANLFGNLLTGTEIIRPSKGMIRAGEGT